MIYNPQTLIPIIHTDQYDDIATSFLEHYYKEGLYTPQRIPILEIARDKIGLDVQFLCIDEDQKIFGITVFEDGLIDLYNPEEALYYSHFFKRKSIIIDPAATIKTNLGCQNNTIAHECVHWYKHRMYYKMQKYTLPRQAKFCRCSIQDITFLVEEERILEQQATGIAPRILMPSNTFTEIANKLNIRPGFDNSKSINEIAAFFEVSKQSAIIRLRECGIL